jgi:hypothetical protein
VVEVRDRRHPLFGRRFEVLRRVPIRSGNVRPSFEVVHVHGATLLVPKAACIAASEGESNVKLSVEALRDLISLVEAFDAPGDDPDPAGGGLVDTPAGAAPKRRRGTCRDSGRGGTP